MASRFPAPKARAGGLFLVFPILLLSGCFLINFPPTVSLSASATDVAAGTAVTITASCYDLNGDALSYTWMVDEVYQKGELSSTFLFSRYPASATSYDVTVRVKDGSNSVSASIVVTVRGQSVTESGFSGGVPWVSGTYSGGLRYTLDVGSTPRDVYFVFTNTSLTGADANPTVEAMYSARNAGPAVNPAAAVGRAVRGRPDVDEFNRTASRFFSGRKASAKAMRAADAAVALGSPHAFYDQVYGSSTWYTVDATCRAVVGPVAALSTGKERTLYVWVADDCWEAPAAGVADADRKTYYVTQAMVDALAAKFLDGNGGGEDVYDWVTNIYGEEWKSTGETSVVLDANLVPASDEVHILLCDIDKDDSADSGTIGYFWSKDNLASYNGVLDGANTNVSNRRVMFYIDAVMFANPEDSAGNAGTWSPSGYWFGETVSTLAHEFQHMIEFYRKSVLQSVGGEDTWLNEMSSQVTEDLVADKLGVLGPRGVSSSTYPDGGAGAADNVEGRLPEYVEAYYYCLVEWSDTYPLTSYSNTYAFGAYLARNYGGAALMRSLQHNAFTDTKAVTSAVRDRTDLDLAFTELVRRWGVATVLSDLVNPKQYCTYNTGAWRTEDLDRFSYRLGSINMYNYNYVSGGTTYTKGPLLFDETMAFTDGTTGIPGPTVMSVGGACNVFYRAGDNVTGSRSWPVEMPEGYVMTVVVR